MKIFINGQCPFLSGLRLAGNFENILLSFGSSLESYLKTRDLPQNGKLDSSPVTVLAGTRRFMMLFKQAAGTGSETDFPGMV